MDNLDTVLEKLGVYTLSNKQKNRYSKKNVDQDLAQRITYRINAPDWQVYIDGNTIRRLTRGFGFCSFGVSFCDDSGVVYRINLSDLRDANVAYTNKSLLINGQCVTLGEVSKNVAEYLILIRKEINAEIGAKKPEVRMAKVTGEVWYLGYEGEVLGPYSREEIASKVQTGEYVIDALQLWTSAFSEWKLIKEIPDFKELFIDRIDDFRHEKVIRPDINHCSREDLLRLPGMVESKVDAFLKRRNAGIQINNVYDLQKEFDLKPHEAELLSGFIIIRVDANYKRKGRILDV